MRFWFFVFVSTAVTFANCLPTSSGKGTPSEKKAEDNGPSDQERIKGLWKPVSLDGGKNPPPPEVAAEIAKKITFRFADGKVIVHQDKPIEPEGKYTLDPTKNPKEIDVKPAKDGPMLRGIYRFENDRLTIRMTEGDTRPKGFDADLSKDELRIILIRVK